MKIAYRSLMDELKLTLESDVLDPAFVTKAKDFEEKLKNKELTAEQIDQIDNELVVWLNNNTVEEESPEVTAANRRRDIAEAKEVIAAATTIEELNALSGKYKELPELQPFIEKRIEKIEKAEIAEILEKEKQRAFDEISAAKYEELSQLEEKYKANPELLQMVTARIAKEKPAPKDDTLREKILSQKKRQWSYDELRALGIKVTGDDMVIEGITFTRKYLFLMYEITAVDNKKV